MQKYYVYQKLVCFSCESNETDLENSEPGWNIFICCWKSLLQSVMLVCNPQIVVCWSAPWWCCVWSRKHWDTPWSSLKNNCIQVWYIVIIINKYTFLDCLSCAGRRDKSIMLSLWVFLVLCWIIVSSEKGLFCCNEFTI